jgi:D-alanyl-D-alanine carboxypeptidase
LDSRIVDKFNAMCQAALNDGVSLISVTAYRTYSYQNTLYNNRVNRCMNENSNLSREEAKKIAATIVALPGTSEHHLGLAVDINSVEETFENTKAFRWLQENAADYGFIMRYPKDKQNITKIIYEPWHYRYVGVEHAKEMLRLDMCMEEYLDHLKTK